MKVPEYYLLPKGFDLGAIARKERMPQYYSLRVERHHKALLFITLINWIGFVAAYSREGDDGWVQIKGSMLKRLLGQGYAREARDMLEDLGVIECDHRYIPGEKSICYRLKPAYANLRQLKMKIVDTRCLKRVRQFNATQPELAVGFPYDAIRENLERFKFKSDVDVLIRRYQKRKRSHREMCRDFVNGQSSFFTKSPQSKRCFHALTSTPKDMRKLLTLDGEDVVEVDIPSAQPLLSATLYNRRSKAHREEMARYLKFIEGDFYTQIAKEAGGRLKIRKKIKVACYQQIFFNRAPSTGQLWQAMKRLFPILSGLIDAQKQGHRSRFAIYLQNAEANLVIHNVGIRLVKAKIPFGTVHDSIVCKKQHAHIVRLQMRKAVEAALKADVNLKF